MLVLVSLGGLKLSGNLSLVYTYTTLNASELHYFSYSTIFIEVSVASLNSLFHYQTVHVKLWMEQKKLVTILKYNGKAVLPNKFFSTLKSTVALVPQLSHQIRLLYPNKTKEAYQLYAYIFQIPCASYVREKKN